MLGSRGPRSQKTTEDWYEKARSVSKKLSRSLFRSSKHGAAPASLLGTGVSRVVAPARNTGRTMLLEHARSRAHARARARTVTWSWAASRGPKSSGGMCWSLERALLSAHAWAAVVECCFAALFVFHPGTSMSQALLKSPHHGAFYVDYGRGVLAVRWSFALDRPCARLDICHNGTVPHGLHF